VAYKLLNTCKYQWARYQAYLRGWRTREKIVVIESDDWGSIRTSSRSAYDRLLNMGYPVTRSNYNFDALETSEDLDQLFEVLDSVKDSQGRPSCITANMIMANPDFDKIRQANFEEYFYEPAGVTLSRDPSRQGVEERWQDGMNRKLFVPQLHAREHICWWQWLKALRNKSREALDTFELGMCGLALASSHENVGFFSPLYLNDEELATEGVDLTRLVVEGSELFEKQFGFKPLSAIAPNYCWTDHVEDIWSRIGIRYIQGDIIQKLRTSDGPKLRCHYLGERNRFDSCYMVRNCFFEPASERKDWVGSCLKEIARAFCFHKPAVICSHRVNFIGAIDTGNRHNTLRQLSDLLKSIVSRWPDVCFISSDEIGTCMESDIRSRKIKRNSL
jgi:hypothetical protein